MKSIIEYNKKTNLLIIKDISKNNSFIMDLLMILNIINAIIWILNKNTNNFEFYSWVFIGLISFLILLYKYLKNDTSKEIPIDNIKYLKVKKVFGNERFSLILKNGKKRILLINKNSSELKKIFNEIGIKIVS